MDYIQCMNPKEFMEFIEFAGLERFASSIGYIDRGEYIEVLFNNEEKELFTIKFYNFFLLLEDNYNLFSEQEQRILDLNYKYFMTYKFGNKDKDYSPYKEDLLDFYTSLYGSVWKECENIQGESKTKKITQKVADESQFIADQISKEMFIYKRNANPEFLNKKFRDCKVSKYIFTDGYYFD